VNSSRIDGREEKSTSLQQLIAESDHLAGQGIRDFTRLGMAVQAQRHKMGVSKTDRITRSTALWTLMQLDEEIKGALQDSGVDQASLGDVLSIRDAPRPMEAHAAELHEDFARGMRAYLAELTDQRPIELPHLAAAILRAGRDDSGGLLPDRLKKLDVDLKQQFGQSSGSLQRFPNSPKSSMRRDSQRVFDRFAIALAASRSSRQPRSPPLCKPHIPATARAGSRE
jgi:hypothetical protein